MCVNMRWVKNPYTRQNLFVPCRQCPSCQQEQANRRAQRIKNNQREDCVTLFCTLTYDNDTVPYVRKEDLLFIDRDNPVLNIYRDFNVRRVRADENYRIVKSKRKNGEVISMPLSSFDVDIDSIPELTNKKGCIGVCLYSDVQKFFKRLKINLIRRYHVPEYIKYDYFACTEYGTETSRCHVHALIQCPREYEDIFRLAVNESWDFDLSLPRKVEVARDAASYVGSYCNKSASLHPFFKIHEIRQNHSYSQGYGMVLRCFSLAEILQKADRRNLSYDIIKQENGTPVRSSIPIPKYVINTLTSKFFIIQILINKSSRNTRLELIRVKFQIMFPNHQRQKSRGFNLTSPNCIKIVIHLIPGNIGVFIKDMPFGSLKSFPNLEIIICILLQSVIRQNFLITTIGIIQLNT